MTADTATSLIALRPTTPWSLAGVRAVRAGAAVRQQPHSGAHPQTGRSTFKGPHLAYDDKGCIVGAHPAKGLFVDILI